MRRRKTAEHLIISDQKIFSEMPDSVIRIGHFASRHLNLLIPPPLLLIYCKLRCTLCKVPVVESTDESGVNPELLRNCVVIFLIESDLRRGQHRQIPVLKMRIT